MAPPEALQGEEPGGLIKAALTTALLAEQGTQSSCCTCLGPVHGTCLLIHIIIILLSAVS